MATQPAGVADHVGQQAAAQHTPRWWGRRAASKEGQVQVCGGMKSMSNSSVWSSLSVLSCRHAGPAQLSCSCVTLPALCSCLLGQLPLLCTCPSCTCNGIACPWLHPCLPAWLHSYPRLPLPDVPPLLPLLLSPAADTASGFAARRFPSQSSWPSLPRRPSPSTCCTAAAQQSWAQRWTRAGCPLPASTTTRCTVLCDRGRARVGAQCCVCMEQRGCCQAGGCSAGVCMRVA